MLCLWTNEAILIDIRIRHVIVTSPKHIGIQSMWLDDEFYFLDTTPIHWKINSSWLVNLKGEGQWYAIICIFWLNMKKNIFDNFYVILKVHIFHRILIYTYTILLTKTKAKWWKDVSLLEIEVYICSISISSVIFIIAPVGIIQGTPIDCQLNHVYY